MNRIVLIGNGFDLAHGLKTSYNNFMDFLEDDNLTKINSNTNSKNVTGNFCTFDNFFIHNEIPTLELLNTHINNGYISRTNYNSFFQSLKAHKNEYNWVDIEHFYFQHLNQNKDLESLKILNEEFTEVQNKFEEYVTKQVKTDITQRIFNREVFNAINDSFHVREFKQDFITSVVEDIFEIFKEHPENKKESIAYNNDIPFSINNNQVIHNSYLIQNDLYNLEFLRHIPDILFKYPEKIIKSKIREGMQKDKLFKPNDLLFLNFNYTNVEDLYKDHKDLIFNSKEVNHIHGEIGNKKNNIIFGFGDEYGTEYSDLELKYNNEYFRNIKSFKYLETNNYRNLLDFINKEPYQISLFGHSCGHSDRTLLKTLFEHKNCVSIKPYYRLRKDTSDNYFELVGNISRNFSNKMEMRDKVVNKQYCKPFITEK